MATIDERVVAMSFENARFEAGIAQTMAGLTKLNESLANIGKINGLQNIEAEANKVTLTAPMTALDKLKAKLGITNSGTTFSDMEKSAEGVTLAGPMTALDKLKQKLGVTNAGTTFSDMEAASDKVHFAGLTSAIDGIGSHLSFIQTSAAVAFGSLVAQATQAGAGLAKALSLDSISGGLKEYETNLNSIQTILANTQASGATLDDVNAALQQLNKYSDQTIFNFSEMAKNIGTFTAAGVDLDTSVHAIKGIANLAALSGSNSQQASTAMYQLSQAISAGRVSLQDWNSVVNAGMGGTVFQRALAQTAQKMGKLKDGAVALTGPMKNVSIDGESFRESITIKPGEKSWLTSDVLTKTLSQFTGDLSDAELAAQGFSDAEIKSIQQTAQTAKSAATEVKTLSQVFDVAKETMGSGWSATFQAIFGSFTEAKKTFTELSTSINGFINDSANARNKVLGDWKELGGRKELIEGIKNVFDSLGKVLSPIRDAFRQVFPAKTGQQLFEMTKAFRDFTDSLKIGPETADALRRTFAGLFAVLDIGWTIVKKIAGVIGDLIGVVAGGSGGFLGFTAAIGDFLVGVDNAISKGDALKGIFEGISAVLQVPLEILKALAGAFFSLFSGVDPGKADIVAGSLERVGERMKPLEGTLEKVTAAWNRFVDILQDVKHALQPVLDDIADTFSNIVDVITKAIASSDFGPVFTVLQTGLLGGIFLTLKKGLKDGLNITFGDAGGMIKNLGDMFGALTGNLTAMQRNVQAGTLLKIAAAIAVLAGGVFLLSQIDPKKLTRAMTAVAVGLGELVGALALLSKFAGGTAFIGLPLLAVGLVAVATAVVILAGAIKIFSTMSWEDIGKGLFGVAGALTAIGVGLHFIGPEVLLIGPGLIAVAIAIDVLSAAVLIFSKIKWEDLAKGLVGIAGALLAIAGGMALMGPEMLLIGPGLIAVSIGVSMLAGAVRSFGDMKPEQLAQGIIGMGLALAALAGAIILIPPTVALQAAGLVILAVALQGIAKAVQLMGGLDIEVIIRGLTAIAGVLLIFAIGLEAMAGTLPGSAALLVAAAAFAILAPTLAFLGTLKWGTIFKGLAAIALTLATLAIAGALAAGPLALLGAAMVVLGLGLLAVTAPIYILAKSLQILGAEGTKGIAVMVAALTAFALVLPKIILDFIKGLVGVIAEVAKLAPSVLLAVGTMLDTIIAFVIEAAPKLAVAVGALIQMFIKVINDNTASIIAAGLGMLTSLLTGISGNIGLITLQVVEIISRFLNSFAASAPQLSGAGVIAMSAFLAGIAAQLPRLVGAVTKMIVEFVGAVAENVPQIVGAAVNLMVKFIATVVSFVPKLIEAGFNVLLRFIEGIGRAAVKLVDKGVEAAGKFVGGVAKGLVKLADMGFDAMIDFLNGIAEAIRKRGPELRAAGWNVADALMDGIRDGIHELGHRIADELEWVIKLLPKKAREILGISSPSKVFMEIGQLTMAGLVVGIGDGSSAVVQSMESMAKDAVGATTDALNKMPDMLDGLMDVDPVITPILDLTKVAQEARKLDGMTNVVPISAAASFDQAAAISAEKASSETVADGQAAQASSTFNFEQNNYSPKALSEIEIYRQTNNQLAQLRSAVGLA